MRSSMSRSAHCHPLLAVGLEEFVGEALGERLWAPMEERKNSGNFS